MREANAGNWIISQDDVVLVTGAAGFVGCQVVARLAEAGFKRIRCLVRPTSDREQLLAAVDATGTGRDCLEFAEGNLLSPEVATSAATGVRVAYHLAAGTGSKSFPDAFLNSVVTTRNLIEALLRTGQLSRFVNLSSFAVYSNLRRGPRGTLDETSEIEPSPASRAEAYCFAKVKQDELVMQYGAQAAMPFVLVRPGVVYGPGKHSISGRVGIDSFGIFLHLGGGNRIPFTYVANCAEAIVLAGLRPGIDGQAFNIVDDNLPTSRHFLRQYKRNVRSFNSIYLPKFASYLMCLAWEKLVSWSGQQLPGFLSRREWHATWKRTNYSNRKAKTLLGWEPRVATPEGMKAYFASCRRAASRA